MKRQHRNDKELTEIQTLKQENKNLREENKSLKRQIRMLEKKEHIYDEAPFREPEPIEEPTRKRRCEDCGKGYLEEKNVLGRYWSECDNCSWRSKVIKK